MRQADLFGQAPSKVRLDPTGPVLRDKGHALTEAADPETADWLRLCLDRLCAKGGELTSDDLHGELEAARRPVRPALIGPVMRGAAVAGKLRDTGRCVKTTRVSGQARKITVWEVVR